MKRYFQLYGDVYVQGRWYVSSPVDAQGQKVDPWQFGEGAHMDLQQELVFPLRQPGLALDFSEAGIAIPFVSQKGKEVLQAVVEADAQFFRARVEAHEEPYYVMNVTRLEDCIDEARCFRVLKWKPEDGRPERLGDYRAVERMRIDAERARGARVLRPKGWPVLVVSEEVKEAMEREGLTGAKFKEV